jgi:DNA-binding Lrp family transcriptional regulator
LAPDSLDLDMLREMYRNGTVNLAGIDPRLNATRIAHRLRIGRARVAARLKAWRESGFLQRYDVWLNPALFGYLGAWVAIRVDHPRAKPSLMSRLALLEGAVGGTDYLGEWASVALVFPDLDSLDRTLGLIRGLAGVRSVEPPAVWRVPKPERPLTPLDIRIVRALRDRPTATLSETARRVGISTRTMTRRYGELVESGTVWFVPIFDFRAVSRPVVMVEVVFRPGVAPDTVARRLRARYPLLLELRTAAVGTELVSGGHVYVVMPPGAAHLEELELFVAGLEDVAEFEINVAVRLRSFPAWFDRHLETLARAPSGGSLRGR